MHRFEFILKTMAFSRSLILLLLAVLAAGMSCRQSQPSASSSATGQKTYAVHGFVVALDAANHTATLRHDKIQGWMEAMTMEFPVKDRTEFSRLAVGDEVNATLYVNDLEYYLGKIEIVGKAPAK